MHAYAVLFIINYDDAKIKNPKKNNEAIDERETRIKVPNQIAEALTHMGNNLRSSTC